MCAGPNHSFQERYQGGTLEAPIPFRADESKEGYDCKFDSMNASSSVCQDVNPTRDALIRWKSINVHQRRMTTVPGIRLLLVRSWFGGVERHSLLLLA